MIQTYGPLTHGHACVPATTAGTSRAFKSRIQTAQLRAALRRPCLVDPATLPAKPAQISTCLSGTRERNHCRDADRVRQHRNVRLRVGTHIEYEVRPDASVPCF